MMIRPNDCLFTQGEWSEWLPALSTQRSHVILDHLTRGEARPLMSFAMVIEGKWDPVRLETAIATGVNRYDGFRVRFANVDGEIMINAFPATPHIEYCQLEGETDERRLRYAKTCSGPRLDMAAGLSSIWSIHRDAPDRHLVAMITHHAVLDGASKVTLMEDIAKAYADGPESLPPVESESFEETARNTAQELAGSQSAAIEAFWRDYLTPMPGDLGRDLRIVSDDLPSFDRVLLREPVDPAAARRMIAAIAPQSTRPFVIWASLFARCFAADAPKLVSVTTSARDRPSRRRSVGCMVKGMPMRLHWQGNQTPAKLDGELKTMLRHAMLPIDDMAKRGILPTLNRFDVPTTVQFDVRRDDAKAVVDRPDLRISFVSALTGVNNLQPIAVNIRHGEPSDFGFDINPDLADVNNAKEMIDKLHAQVANW